MLPGTSKSANAAFASAATANAAAAFSSSEGS